jgi:hypothetical protein
MKRQIKGLELAGIIIVYLSASSLLLAMILSLASWGWLAGYEVILLIVSLASLFITILYHNGKIKSRVLVGIFGTLVSVIGGIFILVSKNDLNSKEKDIKVDTVEFFQSLLNTFNLYKSQFIDLSLLMIKKQEFLNKLLPNTRINILRRYSGWLIFFNLLLFFGWVSLFIFLIINEFGVGDLRLNDYIIFFGAGFINITLFFYAKKIWGFKVLLTIVYSLFLIVFILRIGINIAFDINNYRSFIVIGVYIQLLMNFFVLINLRSKYRSVENTNLKPFYSELVVQKSIEMFDIGLLSREEVSLILQRYINF